MNQIVTTGRTSLDGLCRAADQAGRAIAPAWPLAASVAVNPFLGQSGHSMAETAELLPRLTGVDILPPRSWFAERIRRGSIRREDLESALARHPVPGFPTPEALAALAEEERQPTRPIADVATLSAGVSGIDWPRIRRERISVFAAGYFDEGQALWIAARSKGAYAAWQLFATHDLTPEIAGLAGFAAAVADMPRTAAEAIAECGAVLGLGQEPGHYFHQLLLTLGGTAQYARHLQFAAERDGGEDGTLTDLLAISLAYEAALFRRYGGRIAAGWAQSLAAYRSPLQPEPDRLADVALLTAAEIADSRPRIARLETAYLSGPRELDAPAARPALQAAFCIDVRSEVFRRALETVDAGVVTLGFAGFFGMGVSHRRSASDLAEHRMPVLLPAGRFSCEAVTPEQDRSARYQARAVRAFARFRQAAVSSFAFIEAMGPVYAGKLLGQTLRLGSDAAAADAPMPVVDAPLDDRIQMAESVLRAMSLTENLARLVLLAGHGATSANNPFLAGLHCGACGGHAGDVNARLLASLLNDKAVREGLSRNGIHIPSDTLFLAGLHDTTTDAVTLFDGDREDTTHQEDIARLRGWLRSAGLLAASERTARLPRGPEAPPERRSRDWAETRPEWGLAGCSSFIAAPRSLTAAEDLSGRTFLHDYVWQRDKDFQVLELILTAPVVVASWISLQYFGSAVAPALFGSGNKLLHNVVGGIGVIEGNGGPMRAGLPWQSVHDGEQLVHEPLRLAVHVAAPVAAVGAILARHAGLRDLADKGWIALFVLDPGAAETLRYAGDGAWQPCTPRA